MSQSPSEPSSAYEIRENRPASRGAARRMEILAVAEDVFLKQGYDSTSVDEIATSVGASKATIYKYFGSKKSLFLEILHNIVPDLTGDLINEMDSGNSFRTIIFNWSMRIIEMVTVPRTVSMYRLIVTEAIRGSEINLLHYESGPRATQKELANFLREAVRRGQIDCDEPDLAARVFASAAFGEPFEYALLGLPKHSTDDLVAYLNQAITMLETHCRLKEWG